MIMNNLFPYYRKNSEYRQYTHYYNLRLIKY